MKDITQPLRHVGLLGGTFDPIHYGHLHIAQQALQQLQLDQLIFIPAGDAPLRDPACASKQDRLTMLKLALKPYANFSIDDIELQNSDKSYSINTMAALQQENTILYFILGVDRFVHFDQWHRWREIPQYCHLIVVNRPHYSFTLNPSLQAWYKHHQANSIAALKTQASGKILALTLAPSAISATAIRQQLKQARDVSSWLPLAVVEYIQQHKLYR